MYGGCPLCPLYPLLTLRALHAIMLKTERNIANAVVDGRAATLVYFYLDQSEARSTVTSFVSIEVFR